MKSFVLHTWFSSAVILARYTLACCVAWIFLFRHLHHLHFDETSDVELIALFVANKSGDGQWVVCVSTRHNVQCCSSSGVLICGRIPLFN